MNKFAGLNLDFGNVFLNGYGTAFTHVNANHVRLFPWNSLADATVRNTLKNVLDSAQSFGISVSIVLNLADISSTTGEERAFIRGYPVSDASPAYPIDIDKMKADFDALYAIIGSHSAIHSWDIHNEPAPWHYWNTNPTYRARDWCIATADYIRSKDTLHRPIYIGLSNLESSQTTNYNGNNLLLDANAYTDVFGFHYYPQLGHIDEVWTTQECIDEVNGATSANNKPFPTTMQIVRNNNPRNLPVILDEFGIASYDPDPTVPSLAWTDEAGQAALYDAVFKQVVQFPELVGVTPWEALFTNRFSIFRSDGSDRPSALVVRDFYPQFLASARYAFSHWQDGDTNPIKTVNL